MELLIFTIGCIIILWLLNRWRLRHFVKLLNKIPSHNIHKVFGFGPVLKPNGGLKYICDYSDKYGLNSMVWVGPIPFFLTADPEIIKDVLNAKQSLHKPELIYKGIEYVLQRGLLTNNEPFWNQHRKLLSRAFSYKNLLSFVPIFNHTTAEMMKQMDTMISNGHDIDMRVLFRELTIHNSTQLMAEISFNRLWDIGILRKLAEITIFKDSIKRKNEMEKFFFESIHIAKDQNTQEASYMPDVKASIDYALEGINQNILNIQEVEGEMKNLFAAAFETASTTLFTILVLLSIYPEIQERAFEEIISIVPESEKNHVTIDHIDEMVYLGMIISESMRVFPAVPCVFREVVESDLTLANGVTLPKGQRIFINIYHLHRNKNIWGPNADQFNPDNFLPANLNSIHPYAYIPFTKGPRNCLGSKYAQINMKITLTKLLRAYKFSTDFKFENLIPESNVTLVFAEQPKLQVQRR